LRMASVTTRKFLHGRARCRWPFRRARRRKRKGRCGRRVPCHATVRATCRRRCRRQCRAGEVQAAASARVCESPLVGGRRGRFLPVRNREFWRDRDRDEDVGGLDVAWTIPLLCAASRASATSIARVSRLSNSIGLPLIRCFRVWPLRHSITMNRFPSCWPISWMVQMLGGSAKTLRGPRGGSVRGPGGPGKRRRGGISERRNGRAECLPLCRRHPSAATEKFEDAVMRDSLADHGRSGDADPRCTRNRGVELS